MKTRNGRLSPYNSANLTYPNIPRASGDKFNINIFNIYIFNSLKGQQIKFETYTKKNVAGRWNAYVAFIKAQALIHIQWSLELPIKTFEDPSSTPIFNASHCLPSLELTVSFNRVCRTCHSFNSFENCECHLQPNNKSHCLALTAPSFLRHMCLWVSILAKDADWDNVAGDGEGYCHEDKVESEGWRGSRRCELKQGQRIK